MNLYFIFIIFISLIGIKIFIKQFNKDYLSKDNTACIKGIFILIVFFSHSYGYLKLNFLKDGLMTFTRNYLGQLMVAMFLFYSGYGIYESIKKKKENYINSIPKNRILKTFIHFDIAVLIFLIVRLILGTKYNIIDILLALSSWTSIGNSNWYITAILLLYFLTYFSFKIFDKDPSKAILLTWITTILTMIGIFALRGKGYEYCYNTMLCYPLGLTYSLYKEKIEQKFFDNNKLYILTMIVLIIFTLAIKRLENVNTIYYSINALIFTLLVVGLTMKINLKSPILKWFGDNLFCIYIYQRIPFLLLSHMGLNTHHQYRFFLIAFIITIILATIFNFIYQRLDNIIFKNSSSLPKKVKRLS